MATGGAWYSYWLSLRLLPLVHCGADQLTIHCLQLTYLRQRIYCLFTFYRSVSMTNYLPPVSIDVMRITYSTLDILDRMSNCPYFQFITFDSIRQHAMTFISRQSMSTQNAMAQIQPSQEYKSVVTFIWTGNWRHCDSSSMTEGSILAALSAIVATRTSHCPVPLHWSLSNFIHPQRLHDGLIVESTFTHLKEAWIYNSILGSLHYEDNLIISDVLFFLMLYVDFYQRSAFLVSVWRRCLSNTRWRQRWDIGVFHLDSMEKLHFIYQQQGRAAIQGGTWLGCEEMQHDME